MPLVLRTLPRALTLGAVALVLLAAGPAAALDPLPAIMVSPETFDFGTLDQKQVRTTEITVTNAGGAPLEIERLETTCGCTAAEPAKKLLEPGESTLVTITFDSKTFSGEQHKSVLIHSNDPTEPTKEIKLTAFVHAPLIFTPSWKSIGFGMGRVSEMKPQSITVMSPDVESLVINLSDVDTDLLSVEVLPTAKNDPRERQLVFTVNEGAPAGVFRELAVFQTNVPDASSFDLEITGDVQADVSLMPARHNFRYVGPGQDLSRVFYLKKPKDAKVKVVHADVDLPGFEVAEIKESSHTGNVEITVKGKPIAIADERAKEARGRMSGTLTVVTDEPGSNTYTATIMYLLKI
ncbi:MAG TPA: DUF1573 domain-containing protein [Candidatus Krumholzibacteria bacterium]|nr:DUF1573 domain-containing protein [Candidatus Krumholzibacteria bacterium]